MRRHNFDHLIGPAIAASSIALALLWARGSWWGPDDGSYAFLAEQVLKGKVLGRDIQDIHAGYLNFLNAAVFSIFGRDIYALRVVPALLTGFQAWFAFSFLRAMYPQAVAGVLAFIFPILTFALFPNVTANWYIVFFAALLAAIFTDVWRLRAHRTIIIGAICGVALCFRQPSGVFLSTAALIIVLMEASIAPSDRNEGIASRNPWLARVMLSVVAAVLGYYLLHGANISGFVLFGAPPMAILVWAICRVNAGVRDTASILVRFGVGALASLMPLLLYHITTGSLGGWLSDIVITPLGMRRLDFFNEITYTDLFLSVGWVAIAQPLFGIPSAIFWSAFLFSGIVLFVLLAPRLVRGYFDGPAKLGVVALFNGIIALHFEIVIYLIYAAGFNWLAILGLLVTLRARRAIVALTICMLAFAIIFHAGQPISRRLEKVLTGERVALVDLGLPKASIGVDPFERGFYYRVLDTVNACTEVGEKIFAFPTNAEIYFLAERDPPFRYFSTAYGLQTPEAVEAAKRRLVMPRLSIIIHRSDDKYNSDEALALADFIAASYHRHSTLLGFHVYTDGPPEAGSPCAKAAASNNRWQAEFGGDDA